MGNGTSREALTIHVREDGSVQLSLVGFNLPGRVFCRPDGSLMTNVHVGVQVRREPSNLVRADAAEACWSCDIEVVERDGQIDFRGPAVQGTRGERFVYLTWGEVSGDHQFEMFRRAKLMLHRVDPTVMDAALRAGRLLARIDLTGDRGGPRCARVDPPAIEWSVPT
jgi:Family of unknown function (DUF5990)